MDLFDANYKIYTYSEILFFLRRYCLIEQRFGFKLYKREVLKTPILSAIFIFVANFIFAIKVGRISEVKSQVFGKAFFILDLI